MAASHEVTRWLQQLDANDPATADRLFDIVYDELYALARNCFQNQPPNHTLQPTALVNEAFIRLIGQARIEWRSRAHFLAVAAKAMRRILIDHARGKRRIKRGGEMCRVTAHDAVTPISDSDPEMLDLDEALQKLARMDQRQSRIVELRFFGGMTMDEIAHVLGVSKTTVEADWRMARAWLRHELTRGNHQ